MSLADMYEKIASYDYDVEDQYEELSDTEKTAAEYDAAGRIMARGFADELSKLAETTVQFGKMKPLPSPQKTSMPPTGPLPKVEAMAKKKPVKSRQLPGLPASK